MSEVKVSSIKSQEAYPILVEKGFNKAKNCGPGNSGYIKVLGLNLIESLILRQNETINNLSFIIDQIDENEAKEKYPRIFQLFLEIQGKKQVDHIDFVKQVKDDISLLNEIQLFSLDIYRINVSEMDFSKITESLNNASTNLNIQFIFYSESQLLHQIIANRYIDPIVLNFYFCQKEPQTFYMLYHSNYQNIHEANLNTSSLFDLSLRDPYQEIELTTIKEFIKKTASLNLKADQIDILQKIIQELKEIDSEAYSFEQLIQR